MPVFTFCRHDSAAKKTASGAKQSASGRLDLGCEQLTLAEPSLECRSGIFAAEEEELKDFKKKEKKGIRHGVEDAPLRLVMNE